MNVTYTAPPGVGQVYDADGTVYTPTGGTSTTGGTFTGPASSFGAFAKAGCSFPDSFLSILTSAGKVAASAQGQSSRLIGTLLGANMNVTTDQPIPIVGANGGYYVVDDMFVTNPSTSLTTAVGGLYTAAAKGGVAVIANTQVYSVAVAATDVERCTIATAGKNARFNAASLIFALSTPQGSAATADIYLFGRTLS